MPCFNRRLRQLREEAGLSQQELSNQTGVTKSSINMYERGEREPGLETLEIFADYFNVDMNYLTGFQVQKHIRQIENISLTPHETDVITAYRDKPAVQPKVDELLEIAPVYTEPSNVEFVDFRSGRSIPVLGRVPAGIPIEAVCDVVDTIQLDEDLSNDGHEYFGLWVQGHSMEPEYRNGDYVIVRVQQAADSGDDVIAYIGYERDATLKRLHRDEKSITLRALNQKYDSYSFTHQEAETLPLEIAGVVVELVRRNGKVPRMYPYDSYLDSQDPASLRLADSGPTDIDKFFSKKPKDTEE